MFDFLRNTKQFGNALMDYAVAILVFAVVVLAVTVVQRIVLVRIGRGNPEAEKNRFKEVVTSFRRRLLPITYLLAVYAALSVLTVPAVLRKVVDKSAVVLVSFFVIMFVSDCVRIFSRSAKDGSYRFPAGVATVFQILVWIVGILFIFSNLGYNISTFITGLGIGGVAVALASQAILGDLFNYFVILFDKPFEKGDSIAIGDKIGTVEFIGIKSTRIRSATGELLLVSNTDLTKSRIQNFQIMNKRRNLTILGLEYGTPLEKLKKVPDTLKKAVESVKETEFSRVHFSEFASSSLNFELAYFVLSSDYSEYVKTVQNVNFAIMESFAALGVSFAFPTQTVYLKTDESGENPDWPGQPEERER